MNPSSQTKDSPRFGKTTNVFLLFLTSQRIVRYCSCSLFLSIFISCHPHPRTCRRLDWVRGECSGIGALRVDVPIWNTRSLIVNHPSHRGCTPKGCQMTNFLRLWGWKICMYIYMYTICNMYIYIIIYTRRKSSFEHRGKLVSPSYRTMNPYQPTGLPGPWLRFSTSALDSHPVSKTFQLRVAPAEPKTFPRGKVKLQGQIFSYSLVKIYGYRSCTWTGSQ